MPSSIECYQRLQKSLLHVQGVRMIVLTLRGYGPAWVLIRPDGMDQPVDLTHGCHITRGLQAFTEGGWKREGYWLCCRPYGCTVMR